MKVIVLSDIAYSNYEILKEPAPGAGNIEIALLFWNEFGLSFLYIGFTLAVLGVIAIVIDW